MGNPELSFNEQRVDEYCDAVETIHRHLQTFTPAIPQGRTLPIEFKSLQEEEKDQRDENIPAIPQDARTLAGNLLGDVRWARQMTYSFKVILPREWWLMLFKMMRDLERNVHAVIPEEAGPTLFNDDGVGILGAF